MGGVIYPLAVPPATGPATNGTEAWPVLDPAALHGLAGDVVRTLDPFTESDPVGVLASFLTAAGAAAGPGPHAVADGAEHPGRLFTVLVGKTSRGRKGTAQANVRRIMAAADPVFCAERILGGLASGEGLVAAVSDGSSDGRPSGGSSGRVFEQACWGLALTAVGVLIQGVARQMGRGVSVKLCSSGQRSP